MFKNKKILVLGPLSNKMNPTNTGGIIVLFENYVSWLKKNYIDFNVIDLNKVNYSNKFYAFFTILFTFLKKQINCSSVSLHGTANDYLFIAPIVVFVCKLFNKKIILRKFAGSFDSEYSEANIIKKSLYKYILKNADVLFFESKKLVNFGQKFNSNSFWLPNVRNQAERPLQYNTYEKKFLFISHVSIEKGVSDLLKIFENLDDTYTLDIYGKCIDIDPQELNVQNIIYHGPVENKHVSDIISKHDVIILPSKRKEEGYPGIIIEAYSQGRPVISSRIGGISEIVNHGLEGILIEPGNLEELKNAIEFFDRNNYMKFCENSSSSFSRFESNNVYKSLKEYLT